MPLNCVDEISAHTTFIFVDEAAEDGPALDPLGGEVGEWVVGPERPELAASMRAPAVVMGRVPGQDGSQVPLAEDQHPIGELGPDGEHEPSGITVRSRDPRRDLHGLDPGISQHRVEGCGELPGPVWIRNRKPTARSPCGTLLAYSVRRLA